jgi:hypothetical protein
MAVPIFNLSIRDLCGSIKWSWMDRDLPQTYQTCLFCVLNHHRPKNSPSDPLKSSSRQPREAHNSKCTRSWCYLSCFTSSRRRQGHCYITAVDVVMLRTGYVNSTVRTFAMLFSVATVVRPCRIPLDLHIISLFMWDFLQFREEVIGLC